MLYNQLIRGCLRHVGQCNFHVKQVVVRQNGHSDTGFKSVWCIFLQRRVFATSRLGHNKKDTTQVDTKTAQVSKKTALPISDFKRLLKMAKPERLKITGAIGCLVVSSSVTLSVPFFMGKIIDIINTAAQDGSLMTTLNTICSWLLLVFIVGGVANFGRVYLMQISGFRIVNSMREKLFGSIIRQEIAFFDRNKTGELINRLSADTALVGQSVTVNISDGLRSVAQAIGSIGMMVYVSPKLTLIALAIVPPVAIMSRIYGRYVRSITKDVQDSLADATTVAEERLSNIRTVRAFAQEERESLRYNLTIRKVLELAYKQSLAQAVFWGSTGMSGNVIVLSVFYAGGLMMSESALSIGELSAFLLYAAYIGVSIAGMTSFYTELMRGLGASTRIWDLSDRQPLVPFSGGLKLTTGIQGQIEFRDITFSYPARTDAQIFDQLSLSVPAGSVTAVVGSSGSGKSTLGSLLLRFYDPDKGSVIFDGHDVKELDPIWLRGQIGTVSQEPALFSCSILDNIRYGAMDSEKVEMDKIIEAAKQANAYNFIMAFPEQFDTLVGERGIMLSGGQRQRIAIARAILKDPKILLLDEATSALDAESEYLVKEALDRLMVGRTVITIAHRLSTIMSAHQIGVLHEGRIAELGSYSELMTIENGMFKRLVERQTITS